jgi:hypothetical protein
MTVCYITYQTHNPKVTSPNPAPDTGNFKKEVMLLPLIIKKSSEIVL